MYKHLIKRLLDILISGTALILLSPIYLVLTVLVRIKLGSPVLFKQARPGKRDRSGKETIFRIFKYRTMTDERDENGDLLPDTVRLTSFGRLLRATSLDELPELVNIFKGDMSLVGPRPLAVEYVPYYTPEEHRRHDVRPGLTGWAQVNGRNSLSWEEKFRYDLEYVDNMSLAFDLKILFMTVKKVFSKDGIGQGEERPVSLHVERKDWIDENGQLKEEYKY